MPRPESNGKPAKVAYVKSQGQTRDHKCHWPGCNKQVAPAMWGCYKHWMMLPPELRKKIWGAFRPGQEVNGTPNREYVKVAREVQVWIATIGGEQTGNKLRTKRHVILTPQTCNLPHDETTCPVCDGGLSVCSVCGEYEAGLDNPCVPRKTTPCPATSEETVLTRCPDCNGKGTVRVKDPTGHGDTDTVLCKTCNPDGGMRVSGVPSETSGWIFRHLSDGEDVEPINEGDHNNNVLVDSSLLQEECVTGSEKLAVNIPDCDYIPAVFREAMGLSKKVDLTKPTLVYRNKNKSEEDEYGFVFTCPLLEAALLCDMIRSRDRKVGFVPTRLYIFRRTWQKILNGTVLTETVDGKARLSRKVFRIEAVKAAWVPKKPVSLI